MDYISMYVNLIPFTGTVSRAYQVEDKDCKNRYRDKDNSARLT